jgi:signal transduction histidine kinase
MSPGSPCRPLPTSRSRDPGGPARRPTRTRPSTTLVAAVTAALALDGCAGLWVADIVEPARSSLLVGAGALLAVAVVAAVAAQGAGGTALPLRSYRRARLIRSVRRRLERDGSRQALDEAADAAARALGLRHAVLTLHGAEGRHPPERVHGPDCAARYRFPIAHGGATLGTLTACGPAGTALSPAHRSTLRQVAAELGSAVRVLRLTALLAESRRAEADGRVRERQRLSRDLHDGLGPVLAAARMRIDTARSLLATDPAAADALLEVLQADTGRAVADVRRLLLELRHPAVAEGGLLQALRAQAERLHSATGCRPRVRVEAGPEVDRLPPPVADAVHQIASEALTNVVRHADAGRCTVRLAVGDSCELEVVDDGRGLPGGAVPGVGLRSMRERAESLGGVLTVDRRWPRGTRVRAALPLGGGPPVRARPPVRAESIVDTRGTDATVAG